MSEAVEILIKADDQASAKLATVANNAQKASAKTGNAFKDMGRNAKSTTEFFGVLASLTGNSQLAGVAGQVAGMTQKVSEFSEVAKAGSAGAMGFQLGLVGLAATIGAVIGKAIGDIIFDTAKWERAMVSAKEAAADLDEQLKKVQSSIYANQREDIELIRDPDAKRAAYKKMFDELNRDISTTGAQVERGKQLVEEWAEAWQITGERKAEAEEAQKQLDDDKARLQTMKEHRDELGKIIGVRAQEIALIKAANEAKEKSESYLDGLRKEVEYMKATREEQIKLDAARNTTEDDRGEAERLLKERDAIKAKEEAEKELAAQRKKAADEQIRAAEKAAETAERARQKAIEDAEKETQKLAEAAQREVQRVEDIKQSEKERLELMRIELEQGKEAAKVQDLINQGVDAATAKQLAAEEASIEKLKQKKADEAAQKNKPEEKVTGGGPLATLSAVESRLLSRGPVDRQEYWMEEAARSLRKIMESSSHTALATKDSADKLASVKDNTSNAAMMVPVA